MVSLNVQSRLFHLHYQLPTQLRSKGIICPPTFIRYNRSLLLGTKTVSVAIATGGFRTSNVFVTCKTVCVTKYLVFRTYKEITKRLRTKCVKQQLYHQPGNEFFFLFGWGPYAR
jgi:hypothetical protein